MPITFKPYPERETTINPVEDNTSVPRHEFHKKVQNEKSTRPKFQGTTIYSLPHGCKSALPFFCMESCDIFNNKIYLMSLVLSDSNVKCLHLFADSEALISLVDNMSHSGN